MKCMPKKTGIGVKYCVPQKAGAWSMHHYRLMYATSIYIKIDVGLQGLGIAIVMN